MQYNLIALTPSRPFNNPHRIDAIQFHAELSVAACSTRTHSTVKTRLALQLHKKRRLCTDDE